MLPSQVEQLPDLTGYLKYASDPKWQRVRLDAKQAWEATAVDSGGARGSHRTCSMSSDHE